MAESRFKEVKLGSRLLVLGILAAVGGLAGAIGGMMDDAAALQILAQLAIGILGLALAVACTVEYSRK